MKIIHIAVYILLLLSTAIILFLGYEFLWPVEILKPNVQPYRVITKTVKPGGVLVYEVDACKLRNASGIVVRRFVDHVILSQPSETTNIRVGCNKTLVSVTVPTIITAGSWHLNLALSYPVNPFRTKEYNFRTEDFTVIE